ncbi:MAG: hypothetical protein GY765_25500 [bacterium]|nr:hypothetical protein [bacterium]
MADTLDSGGTETLESPAGEPTNEISSELEEGERVPASLIPGCKKNEYGGFSLRYKKFLYILDSNYCVDVKTADASSDYDWGGDEDPPSPFEPPPVANREKEVDDAFAALGYTRDNAAASSYFSEEETMVSEPVQLDIPDTSGQPSLTLDFSSKEPGKPSGPIPPPAGRAEPVFQNGDILPEHLRERCEQDLSTGGGRITIGNRLYLLDNRFQVTAGMTLSYPRAETVANAVSQNQSSPAAPLEIAPPPASPPRPRPPAPAEQVPVRQTEPVAKNEPVAKTEPVAKIEPVAKLEPVAKIESVAKAEPVAKIEPVAKAEPVKKITSKKHIPIPGIVDNLVAVFETTLDKYNISADFFKDTVLAEPSRPALMRAIRGDLAHLNDDTKEATQQGIQTIFQREAGFNLFKAVLTHELYIKSTLSGRGDNMKYFLTDIIATATDGLTAPFSEGSPGDEQQLYVAFFGSRVGVYSDKTAVLKRVYLKIRGDIFQQYDQLMQGREHVGFKALLIAKLYEYTTRLDRGNGITMMRLSRDIMVKKKKKAPTG